ncbi:TetR/AcrR family transcriptional regulator [Clostridium rectalis]|uniref:TetR/AcrR family transcriptional regulator n=1 Tax=Clostridium rectalis TaxID=2040295 RepID=UPI000F62DD78|nr:TetR/AcrR family transcriptional regulator [Clostridium rectalis]
MRKTIVDSQCKDELRNKLCLVCEECWKKNGYRKTSVKEICDLADVAIGTFYSFFNKKEDLFVETIIRIQERLDYQFFELTLSKEPTLNGYTKAIKMLYREYDKIPFLYEVNTPDFIALIKKIDSEIIKKLHVDSVNFFRKAIRKANLVLKVEEDFAIGTLSALLSTIQSKDVLDKSYDHIKLFDFMLDNLINSLFDNTTVIKR